MFHVYVKLVESKNTDSGQLKEAERDAKKRDYYLYKRHDKVHKSLTQLVVKLAFEKYKKSEFK